METIYTFEGGEAYLKRIPWVKDEIYQVYWKDSTTIDPCSHHTQFQRTGLLFPSKGAAVAYLITQYGPVRRETPNLEAHVRS